MGILEQSLDQLEQLAKQHEAQAIEYRNAFRIIRELKKYGLGTLSMGVILGIALDVVTKINVGNNPNPRKEEARKHPVLMITHNALELTNRTVKSIQRQDIPVELFVIDNCSTDQTVEYLEGLGIPMLACEVSMGVSSAWNYGLTNFFGLGYDHVLVVNNDIEIQPWFYRRLLEDGGPFVTGVGVDDKGQLDHADSDPHSSDPHPHFSAFLIHREVWEKVGMFDENMVLYGSDCDYHVRMHNAGIKAYTTGVPFFHAGSGTIKSNPEEASAIHQRANLDRAAFKAKWGCEIGTPDYYALFK